MIIMTDGLRSLAGGAIRSALVRFTHSPVSGAVTGTVSTAVLQSSSATTVAAVGFVGAGLLSFPEALGIIFGANIGTTVTGWLVVLLGFKLKLGTIMLPLVLLGAVVRLFGKGKLASASFALAGFGLIFVGIAMMQEGMASFGGVIDPASLPEDTFGGRIKMAFIGLVATVVTQSSSAGVAATLTALYAGAVTFPQAAALVIGMDVGTTVTAVMASIGGSTGMRRTGLSHVLFNVFTATTALFLLTPYMNLWESLAPEALRDSAGIVLVAFHTFFNSVGVAIAVPLAYPFARLIERLVPDTGPSFTKRLDRALLQQPVLALEAVPQAIMEELFALLGHIMAILGGAGRGRRVDLARLQEALDETQEYIDGIRLGASRGAEWNRLVNLIHTMDHMQRLHERCEEDEDRAVTARETAGLKKCSETLAAAVSDVMECFGSSLWRKGAETASAAAESIRREVKPYRRSVMAAAAAGEIDLSATTRRLEAVRWLRRVSRHVNRIASHLADVFIEEPPPEA